MIRSRERLIGAIDQLPRANRFISSGSAKTSPSQDADKPTSIGQELFAQLLRTSRDLYIQNSSVYRVALWEALPALVV